MKTSFLNEELVRLHNLIRRKSTGSPADLARKLGCSERSVYNKIDRLKDFHLPVVYDPERQSYCYTCEVSIVFNIIIDGNTLSLVKGGTQRGQPCAYSSLQKNFSAALEFCTVLSRNTTQEHRPG